MWLHVQDIGLFVLSQFCACAIYNCFSKQGVHRTVLRDCAELEPSVKSGKVKSIEVKISINYCDTFKWQSHCYNLCTILVDILTGHYSFHLRSWPDRRWMSTAQRKYRGHCTCMTQMDVCTGMLIVCWCFTGLLQHSWWWRRKWLHCKSAALLRLRTVEHAQGKCSEINTRLEIMSTSLWKSIYLSWKIAADSVQVLKLGVYCAYF